MISFDSLLCYKMKVNKTNVEMSLCTFDYSSDKDEYFIASYQSLNFEDLRNILLILYRSNNESNKFKFPVK